MNRSIHFTSRPWEPAFRSILQLRSRNLRRETEKNRLQPDENQIKAYNETALNLAKTIKYYRNLIKKKGLKFFQEKSVFTEDLAKSSGRLNTLLSEFPEIFSKKISVK